jgi:hypothetical protein
VRGGGVFLKRDFFNKNKDAERVWKDFNMGRTDQLLEKMNANADPWDWVRFRNDGSNWRSFVDDLANSDRYTFYVRGKWEGLTGRMIVSRDHLLLVVNYCFATLIAAADIDCDSGSDGI